MKLQQIFRADKLKNLVCERFEREGNTARKIATPSFYGAKPYVAYPGNVLIKESSDTETDVVKFFFQIEQNPALLLTQIFPEGRMVDDLHIEIDKPFLFENKGGERVVTNINNIKSTEIVNIDLITKKPLKVETKTVSTARDKYDIITTKYFQVFSSIFDGYDENKSLKENYNVGYFDNMFQIETAPFYINYEKALDVPRVWQDGQRQVYYSKYCTLKPEKRPFKFYTEFDIVQDHINITLLKIYKIERLTLTNAPTFSTIIY